VVLTSVLAAASLVDAGDGHFGFLATGPAGLKINGSTSEFKANEAGGTLTISVPLGNLKTGIGLRDKHLRGYLDTAHHPKAKLKVERSKLTFPGDNQTKTASAVGQLTLRGVTRNFPFSYKVKRTGIDYHVQGLGSLDIRDYGIAVPCYLGVCVEPQVKLKVRFKLRDK
jgi:polyisoprenoid-binding protein YceI